MRVRVERTIPLAYAHDDDASGAVIGLALIALVASVGLALASFLTMRGLYAKPDTNRP